MLAVPSCWGRPGAVRRHVFMTPLARASVVRYDAADCTQRPTHPQRGHLVVHLQGVFPALGSQLLCCAADLHNTQPRREWVAAVFSWRPPAAGNHSNCKTHMFKQFLCLHSDPAVLCGRLAHFTGCSWVGKTLQSGHWGFRAYLKLTVYNVAFYFCL